jgi:hypothetical protein
VCNLNNEIPYFPFSASFLQLPKVVASAVSVILDFTWFSQFFLVVHYQTVTYVKACRCNLPSPQFVVGLLIAVGTKTIEMR